MIYLTKHLTEAAFEAAKNNLAKPHVALTADDYKVHYMEYHDYSQDYLTFVAKESGTFSLIGEGTSYYGGYWIKPAQRESISYSLDNGETWTTVTNTSVFSGTVLTTPTVQAGDKVLWKGVGTQNHVSGPSTAYCHFSSTGKFDVEGNAMSLMYGDSFMNEMTLTTYGLSNFFNNSINLVNAKNMSLPATTLVNNCYGSMFSNCTSLTTAPELPATTLVNNCYGSMFSNCTSLTTAPELPATTLANGCYNYMFYGCSGLTTAPELPATTLANDCYWSMFSGCTSLTTAPVLSATTLASKCYQNMFSNCTSLTTAPELPATTLATRCYSYMFKGCSGLTTAPVLSATTLAIDCYNSMFSNCTSLNSITCLATNISATDCTTDWVSGVASSGTFTKAASMTSWTTGVNGIPTNWTVVDAT